MIVTYDGTFPFIEDVRHRNFWIITEGGIIRWDTGQLTIPDWYGTDGASIPRLCWSILYPIDQRIRKAAVLHDRLYETHAQDDDTPLSRWTADLLLYAGMAPLGASPALRWAVWSAVRSGGQAAWMTGPGRRIARQQIVARVRKAELVDFVTGAELERC